MPRLNQSQVAKLSQYLSGERKHFTGLNSFQASNQISKALGFDISEAQVLNIAESVEVELALPVIPPKTSKNDAILQSLKRIEDKLDKVIG